MPSVAPAFSTSDIQSLVRAEAPPQLDREQQIDRLKGRIMGQSLGHVLNRQDGLREALPHLMALENALLQKGASVVGNMNKPLLVKVCSQLNTLPLPANDAALHDLQERLMGALEASSDASPYAANGNYLSTFASDDKLLVAEASYTDFADALQEQAPTQPMPLR